MTLFQERFVSPYFQNNNSSDNINSIATMSFGSYKNNKIESDSESKTKMVTEDEQSKTPRFSNPKSDVTSKDNSFKKDKKSRPLKESSHSLLQSNVKTPCTFHDSSFEIILDYLDSEIVSSWLLASNHKIEILTKWISKSVNFCNFWLSDFDRNNNSDALKREYNLFLGDVWLALLPRVQKNRLMESKLKLLVTMALHEYPEGFNGLTENNVFINCLLDLTSTQRSDFKKLLMGIKCKFTCRQHVQNVLAIRSFALISIISGIINLFMGQNTPEDEPKIDANFQIEPTQINIKRILEAIRLSYVDVVIYMIRSKHVQLGFKDENGKSLFFHAAIENSPSILKYLVQQCKRLILLLVIKENKQKDKYYLKTVIFCAYHQCCMKASNTTHLNDSTGHLVNESSESGNSPLHASVNMGHTKCVQLLLSCTFIDVNIANDIVYGSTQLHLAIMHGNFEIIKTLLEKGADPNREMMGMSAIQLVKQFSTNPSTSSILENTN